MNGDLNARCSKMSLISSSVELSAGKDLGQRKRDKSLLLK